MGGQSDEEQPGGKRAKHVLTDLGVPSAIFDPLGPCKLLLWLLGFVAGVFLLAFAIRCAVTYFSLAPDDRFASNVLSQTWFSSSPAFYVRSLIAAACLFCFFCLFGSCVDQFFRTLLQRTGTRSALAAQDACACCCGFAMRYGKAAARSVATRAPRAVADVAQNSMFSAAAAEQV